MGDKAKSSQANFDLVKKQWEKDETLAAYEITKHLGEGAYGVVVAANVRATKEKVATIAVSDAPLLRCCPRCVLPGCPRLQVAVKKIKEAVEDKEQGKLLLRELKLLRHFRGHENVVYIKEIIESPKVSSKLVFVHL